MALGALALGTIAIHAPATLGSINADSYYFSPFDFPGNMVVALLHAPGASDGYILLNFPNRFI